MSKFFLNLGCGNKKLDGFVNVDKFGDPDIRWDLETFPWPWEDNSVDGILLNHVMEHLGSTTEKYFGIIKEMYRICKPDANLIINVPHPRHDNFINDPTHVRPITPEHMDLFSKKANQQWIEMGAANSPLAMYLDVDFEVTAFNLTPEEPWATQLFTEQISEDEFRMAARQYNNVVRSIEMQVRVVKEATTLPGPSLETTSAQNS